MPKYGRKHLVMFGNYLLSEGRRKSIEANTPTEGTLNDRLSVVYHADIENFKEILKKAKKAN